MDPSPLVQYGALGILALAATSVCGVLWKRLSTQQDANTKRLEELGTNQAKQIEELGETHAKRLETLTTEHKAEMRALLERLIDGHQTQIAEHHKLVERMTNVLDSMSRKFDRPDRPSGRRVT